MFMPPEVTKRPFEREDGCVIISILLHRTQTMNNEQLRAVSKCQPHCLNVNEKSISVLLRSALNLIRPTTMEHCITREGWNVVHTQVGIAKKVIDV